MAETFLDEMKRYVGFTAEDSRVLASLAAIVEPHLEALANRFYQQIPAHPEAARVFTGGDVQIQRLKLTLQGWARGLFSGVYDEAYANERFQIGHRHVQIGLPQRYVIGAMQVIVTFLDQVLDQEIADEPLRRSARLSLSRVVMLDLVLICETFFEGSLRESKRLNERLAATNRSLEEANRVKTEFLATTSHELRTPLTSIIGFSRLLLDGYAVDPAERRELLTDVHRSGLHLLGLVDDILDLSRIEAGRLEILAEAVGLSALIAEVTALTRVQAEAKGLSLIVELPERLPAVSADQARLRQVLLNVIGNAVKFTDHGHVDVAAVEENDGSRIRVDVTDTGIGIPAEKLPLLFERFRQLDASHTRRHGGMGLGLAISRALMEQMGGTIRVESGGEGLGTTVTLTVPVKASVQPATAAPERSADSLERRSAVIGGGRAEDCGALAAALREFGYVVRQAATPEATQALVHFDPPDVLVVDLTSASSQEEAHKWLHLLVSLRAHPETRHVRAVVLAAPPTRAVMKVQLDLLRGGSTVLANPLDSAGLKRALARFAPARRVAPFRLLVGDDDPLIFSFVTKVLPAHEYVVSHAASGEEVLRALDVQHFDGLLLDLRMPNGSGYDVIRALTVEGRAPGLRILVITNYPTGATSEEEDLLSSSLVLDVLPKTHIAGRPEMLLERLATMWNEP